MRESENLFGCGGIRENGGAERFFVVFARERSRAAGRGRAHKRGEKQNEKMRGKNRRDFGDQKMKFPAKKSGRNFISGELLPLQK